MHAIHLLLYSQFIGPIVGGGLSDVIGFRAFSCVSYINTKLL